MSTLNVEHLKHENSSSNNVTMDSDGSVAIDTNTLYVDAVNNRVGIGTTGPQAPLDITGNPAGELGAFVYNTNASGYSAIRLGNSDRISNGDHLVYGSSQLGVRSKTGAPITFEPAGTERMRIDTVGRVTTPNQPHAAWRQTVSSTPAAFILRNPSNLVASVSVASTGSNGTVGRVTAPVAGLYQFNVTLTEITRTTSELLFCIYYNGTLGGSSGNNPIPPPGEIIDLRSVTNTQDGHAYSHSIYMAANDYIEFDVYRLASGLTDPNGSALCSAHLIG